MITAIKLSRHESRVWVIERMTAQIEGPAANVKVTVAGGASCVADTVTPSDKETAPGHPVALRSEIEELRAKLQQARQST